MDTNTPRDSQTAEQTANNLAGTEGVWLSWEAEPRGTAMAAVVVYGRDSEGRLRMAVSGHPGGEVAGGGVASAGLLC